LILKPLESFSWLSIYKTYIYRSSLGPLLSRPKKNF